MWGVLGGVLVVTKCGDGFGCSWQLEMTVELGFRFCWVRVSFFFSRQPASSKIPLI